MNKDKKTENVRLLAIDAFERIEHQGMYSNLVLDEILRNHQLNVADRHLLTEFVYGVLQRKLTLDYYLDYFLKNKKIESWVRQNLRVAIYQSIYLDRIPPHAIVSEAVEIAKRKGHRGIASLVNGVLRNIQRRGYPSLDQIEPLAKRLSVTYSLPEWLIEMSIQRLGVDSTVELAKSLNERPRTSVRVNLKQISREEAIKQLQDENIHAHKSLVSPYGLIIDQGQVQYSHLFAKGYLTIQDESSMLVAPALNVQPSDQVLDACSAPGGKATHIASEFLGSEAGGHLTALDLYPNKIKKIMENAKRQNVNDRITVQQMDALQIPEQLGEQKFDRILVDAPCSGLGLMRRKPEIRYNKHPEDLQSLQKLQLEILSAASSALKPAGELIYSTCTFTQEENQEVVRQFLASQPHFRQIALDLPTMSLNADQKSLTIYPHDYGTDGFFISRFVRE